jgi:hypothetical protein
VHDDGVDQEAPSSVYWPILAAHFTGTELDVRRYVTYSIRSRRAGSESFMSEIRQAIWSVDPNLPVADVHTLGYFYRASMARTSFTLVMLAIAGGMALLLGIVGLYGVIAYSVSQRRREIGIRSALGAQQRELTGMFVRHAMWLTGGRDVRAACCVGADTPDVVAAIWNQAHRPRNLRGGIDQSFFGGRAFELSAGASRLRGEPS